MNGIKRKMAKGAAWTLSFKLTQTGLGLVSTVILARLLAPEDFGLVAMATVFIAALQLLSAFSLDVALIQHPNATRSHYDTVWTIQIMFASAIAVVLAVFSGVIAGFYAEPRLTEVILVLAAGTFISGFENTGVIQFRKELQFDKDFIYRVSGRVVSFIVAISAAYYLRSYWALVIGMLAGRTAHLLMSYYLADYRPKFSISRFKELYDFSKWLFINNTLFFLKYRASDFVIGKLAGPTALGTYSVSYEISGIPTTEIVAPINRAIFPGYVKMSSSIDTLRDGYLDVLGMIAVVAIPAAVGIVATSEVMVAALLGAKWEAAAPLIKILALAGGITALESNVGTVYLALGRPRILTFLVAAHLLVLIPSLIVLTYQFGATGAAWATLLASSVTMPLEFGAMFRTLKMRIAEYIGVLWRPALSSAIMYVAVRTVLGDTATQVGSMPPVPSLIIAVAIGAVTYGVALLTLWAASSKPRGAEFTLVTEMKARIKGFA